MAETNISAAEAINKGEAYFTTLKSGSHTVFADEPYAFGGLDKAPSPSDYLCMSLASCKAITLRMYAERKGWPLKEVRINVKLVNGTGMLSGTHTFFCEIFLEGDLTVEQKTRLTDISKACPIQKLLGKQNEIVSSLM